MLKRQDSLLSSSHLETPPPTENRHAKPTGCLPSIFRFFSKYHNRRKLLTFGKKSPKNPVSTRTDVQESPNSSTPLKVENHDLHLKKHHQNSDSKMMLTREATPRSPTLPPEIRLPDGVDRRLSTENAKTPRALVARLMGLEEEEEENPNKQPPTMPRGDNKMLRLEQKLIPNEEKRRQLLQALEKCNQDLESLKNIIMAVQLGDERDQRPEGIEIFKPWPIAGADEDVGRSPSSRSNYTKLNSNGVMPQQRKKLVGKKPGEEDAVGIGLLNKVVLRAESLNMKRSVATASSTTTPNNLWGSKAMVESVEEVCNDVLWGQKREQRNLEMALDNYICRDLIEEVVFDLGFPRRIQRLPFDACRRRISF